MSKLFDIHGVLWSLNAKFINVRNHDTCYHGVKRFKIVHSEIVLAWQFLFVVCGGIMHFAKALSKTKNPHLWQMWLASSQVWLLNHPADMLARHNNIRTINTASNAQHQTNELCAPSICTNWMSATTDFVFTVIWTLFTTSERCRAWTYRKHVGKHMHVSNSTITEPHICFPRGLTPTQRPGITLTTFQIS